MTDQDLKELIKNYYIKQDSKLNLEESEFWKNLSKEAIDRYNIEKIRWKNLLNNDEYTTITENVTNMEHLFCIKKLFTEIELRQNKLKTPFNSPLNNWNVSNVTNMEGMFLDCIEFNQPLDEWNVINVKNMKEMFKGCTKFDQNLDSWKIDEGIVDTTNMFENSGLCKKWKDNYKPFKWMKKPFNHYCSGAPPTSTISTTTIPTTTKRIASAPAPVTTAPALAPAPDDNDYSDDVFETEGSTKDSSTKDSSYTPPKEMNLNRYDNTKRREKTTGGKNNKTKKQKNNKKKTIKNNKKQKKTKKHKNKKTQINTNK